MKWEHLNFEKRKIITKMISLKNSLCEIADLLNMDPTSISKELKRNRYLSCKGNLKNVKCNKLDRFPYVCNCCSRRYTDCKYDQYRYEAQYAQERADEKLHNSRKGINVNKEEFEKINSLVKEGVGRKESVYHIVNSHDINVSVPTIYRWINNKLMTTTKMDLPYAITFKKRKKKIEKYNYSNNKIDRTSRTYLDYLEYRRSFPGEYSAQMDFLGSIKSDSKSILTLTIPELHFVLLKIIENPTQQKVIEFFNKLEDELGTNNFTTVFPSILTDRDPCFIDYIGIEFSHVTGVQRTRLFYCDAFKSSQKGNVENMNKQLRKFFPKKASVDHFTDSQIKEINQIINNTKVASLGGFTPKEAFIKTYGIELLERIFNY